MDGKEYQELYLFQRKRQKEEGWIVVGSKNDNKLIKVKNKPKIRTKVFKEYILKYSLGS